MKALKIVPFLWYAKEAEAAAKFYASVFPDSKIERVYALPVETPSGPAGSVKVVEFTLLGQPFRAMSAGRLDEFNHSISFQVDCADQAELDRYWNAILGNGGKPSACGWIADKWGVQWQITPAEMSEMMSDKDQQKAARVATAMMKMVKLDLATLKAAYQGK